MRVCISCFFFFSSRRRHTRFDCDWSSDVCSSDLFISVVQRGALDPQIVDKRAVEAVQVLDHHAPRFEVNLRVVAGDGKVVYGQVVIRGAPDGYRAASYRHLSYQFVVEHEAKFRHRYFPPAWPLLPRFLRAPRRNQENHPLESLSIRAITTVMLSGPPRSLAMATSSSAPRIGSVSACSTPAISGSVTTRVNPSEHSINTSRGKSMCSSASTSISGWTPSARNSTLCISLSSASAAVNIPRRTCSATSEWSRVSCSSEPPRSKYARLSPTCAMLSLERSEEHTSELQSQSNLVCRLLL